MKYRSTHITICSFSVRTWVTSSQTDVCIKRPAFLVIIKNLNVIYYSVVLLVGSHTTNSWPNFLSSFIPLSTHSHTAHCSTDHLSRGRRPAEQESCLERQNGGAEEENGGPGTQSSSGTPPTHTHTLSLPHTHTHTLSLSHTLTHSLSLSHTLTHTLSLSLTLTHSLSLTHTHTHTSSIAWRENLRAIVTNVCLTLVIIISQFLLYSSSLVFDTYWADPIVCIMKHDPIVPVLNLCVIESLSPMLIPGLVAIKYCWSNCGKDTTNTAQWEFWILIMHSVVCALGVCDILWPFLAYYKQLTKFYYLHFDFLHYADIIHVCVYRGPPVVLA